MPILHADEWNNRVNDGDGVCTNCGMIMPPSPPDGPNGEDPCDDPDFPPPLEAPPIPDCPCCS